MRHFIILAIAVLPLLVACKEQKPSAGEKYKVVTVEPKDQTLTSHYTATLLPLADLKNLPFLNRLHLLNKKKQK